MGLDTVTLCHGEDIFQNVGALGTRRLHDLGSKPRSGVSTETIKSKMTGDFGEFDRCCPDTLHPPKDCELANFRRARIMATAFIGNPFVIQ
jgi:hypothetical protein